MKYRNRIGKAVCGFAVLVFAGGCSLAPPEEFRSLEEYRKAFPPRLPWHPEKNGGELTLQAAQRFALANNPDYISAWHAVNAARFRYYQALSAYLPRLDGTSSFGQLFEQNRGRVNPPVGIELRERNLMTQNSLNASLLLFDGLAREFGIGAAIRDYDRQAASDDNMRRLLLRGVAYAYYDILLAEEEARIAKANLEFQQSSLAQAESRFRFGLVSRAAVLNFKILANAAKSNMLNAQYRADVSRFALTALMGFSSLEPEEKPRLSPLELDSSRLPAELGFYINTALANRPDLKAFRYQLDIARYRRYQAFSGFLPVIVAFAGAGIGTNELHYGGTDHKHSAYNSGTVHYGVRADWNLFNGFATFNLLRERESLEREARFKVEAAFLACVNEVQSAYANYRNAFEQVQLYSEIVKWAYEQRQLVTVEYWGGRETITRLNGAQSDLVGAEGKVAIAIVELNKALAQLNAAVNMPLEEESSRPLPVPLWKNTLENLLKRLDRQYPYVTENDVTGSAESDRP